MAQTAVIASFRRVTPGILASARLAMADDLPETSRSEIALLLKKAAPVLGIDGTTYHIMDILLGLTRADDWKGAARPIVAISNARLAEYTMRSERTVTRCLRKLVEAGVAAYRDSPTGRRFVHRDHRGDIDSGYGIDFTPARARMAELQEMVRAYQERLRTELAARRDIARYARAITDAAAAFPEQATDWVHAREAILRANSTLLTQAEEMKVLYEQITSTCFNQPVSSTGDIHDRPYINTDSEILIESSERADEAIEVNRIVHEKDPTVPHSVILAIPPDLVQSSCVEVQALIGVSFRGWSDIARAGDLMRRMITIPDALWHKAVRQVGQHAASVIIATVLEKSLRNPERILKHAGYFQAMLDRASEGRLRLERSLYGLSETALRQ